MPAGKLYNLATWDSSNAANNVNANIGYTWDEGQAPSTVNNSARSTLKDIKEWQETAEWIDYGYSISYVSTTVFKYHGTDRRTLAPVNRRVRAGVGAGVIYGTVSDVTLSASDTQVTVAWDSGTLDGSLSYVALGILSPTNDSIPRNMDNSFSDITVAGIATIAAFAGAGVATQANQESADSVAVVVTPGRQQYHPSAAKGWVKATTTGGIDGSYNVSSVDDNGTGDATINWSTDFSGTAYCVVALPNFDAAGTVATSYTVQVMDTDFAVGASRIVVTKISDGSGADPNYTMVVAFGDQ